ncbi:transglycosylase domain-containing protein [Paenibacillus lutrae]|uniref:Carboxypeptidase n=1 Tax=Paenibacillus lutrae TaxID=2078573 RepID=A0A7X3FGC7_9BACL|nr:transglycosylase domain-containing protein [Paenibacillus lutrae]MVO99265.1 carboxypeptidase [Paenibacillus lutrae]
MAKKLSFLQKPRVRKALSITFHTLKWAFVAFLAVGIIGGAAAVGYVGALVKDEPVRNKEDMRQKIEENAITGFVYFNDDSVIGQLRTEEDRRLAELSEIPQIVLDAVLAIEDNNFYQHNGVDIKGVTRAVTQKLFNEEVQTGGSTITQQLARRVFLTLDRDAGRKAKELLLSLRMNRLISKDEILLAYLNKIPYGNGATGYNLYGIKAAAKGIFDLDDLNKLNAAQAAYLAGLPQQPSNYSAFTSTGAPNATGFKNAVTRQKLVLKRMLEENKLTEGQYTEALNFDIESSLAKQQLKAYASYPYLMIEAETQAAKILISQQQPDLDPGKNNAAYKEALKNMRDHLQRGGYQVYTSIDQTIYDSMQNIAKNPKNFSPHNATKGDELVGAVMMDSKTGAVLGMIEGRDYSKNQNNLAIDAVRQPGSTMKPLAAYIPAMEKGKLQPASIIDDAPIILKDGSKGYHIPENWNDKYNGLVTARKALNQSYNIPAIKLFTETVGVKEALDFSKKLGITTIDKKDYNYTTGAIGGLEYGVTVKDLTSSYASMSNKGLFNEAFMIRKITDSTGKVVYEHQVKPTRVFSEETAYLITDMMRTVITEGTATSIKKSFKFYGKIPVVGKTGSTQDDGDAWFMGYTPNITVGVWAGYDKSIHKLSDPGKLRAMNIWSLIMNAAVEQKPELFPDKSFTRPNTVVQATVSDVSGKLPSELNRQSGHLVTDWFNRKYIPKDVDNAMKSMSTIEYNGINYIAQNQTPGDMVQSKVVIMREKSINAILKELSGILAKLPAKNRKSLDFYKPKDYKEDAPSEIDPRKDDGNAPASPSSVAVTKSGGSAVVTFQPSGNNDVVGYRLYRSDNGGPFIRQSGKVVLTGQALKFSDSVNPSSAHAYYVTAVDVAGKESAPGRSNAIDSGGLDPGFIPDGQSPGTGAGSGTNASPPGGPAEGSNDDSGKKSPSAPTGLTAKWSGSGLKLKWEANPGKDKVKRYNIYYSEKSTGDYKRMDSALAAEYVHVAVQYDGYYKVSAVNDSGESKLSAAVKYTTR